MCNLIDTLEIPFTHYERNGLVKVNYKKITDPMETGLDAIPNFNFMNSAGFPSMHAKICYEGTGIRSSFGWIQIITGYSQASPDTEVTIEYDVDASDTMKKLGVPFYSYGNLPEIYDPPNNNIGDRLWLKWIADSYLTTMPHRANNDLIQFIVGFRWGYIEYEPKQNRPIEILPIQINDASSWNKHLNLLRKEFNSWNYEEAQI